MSGNTNATSLTVRTYGDGIIEDTNIVLNNNSFDDDVVISFTHSPNNIPRKYSTVIKAYKSSSVKEISLESNDLKYLK